MSTLEMLDRFNRRDEAVRYTDWLSDNGNPVTPHEEAEVRGAVAEPIYGPVVASNLEYFRTQTTYDPQDIKVAVSTLCEATQESSETYLMDLDGSRPQAHT